MKRVKEILIKILAVEESEIVDEMSVDSVEAWDSFNGLMLVSELESVFDIKFTMDEMVAVKCVGDIKQALIRHNIELEID